MSYPYAPADFDDKYDTAWITVPNKLWDREKSKGLLNGYIDQLAYADTVGFDGMVLNEHHQNIYGLMPSPNIIAATLARRTSRSAICVIGNSIVLYNPPIRVAEEFAMLDVISGGRLICGFPVGTPMDTNYCYGQIPALTRDKYAEAHELIIRAWTEDEPFAFDGKYNQLRYVNCWPKPIQRPAPPIFIPGGGSVETYDFCIDNTYSYSYLSFSGYLRAQALMDGYWARVRERGAPDQSPYRAGFAQTVFVADTDAQAEELYAEHAHYFYNRCLHVYPGFADAPGYRTIKTLQLGAVNQYSRTEHPSLSWKDLVEGGYIVAGSTETVRQQMEHLIKSLKVGNIFLLLHVGNMPKDKCMHSTKLFAEKVMPHLRDIWPDHADDYRFWCSPLAHRVAPAPLPATVPAPQMEPAK